MGQDQPRNLSPFGVAALALDQELQRFQRLAEAANRGTLDSRRDLERATRAAREAAECQERLPGCMQQLVETLQAARTANDVAAAALAARRGELEARTAQVDALFQRFEKLGEVAGAVNASVRRMAELARDPAGAAELRSQLGDIEATLGRVVEEARQLAVAAREARVADLVADAEALRQQVQSAKNKLALLGQRLADEIA